MLRDGFYRSSIPSSSVLREIQLGPAPVPNTILQRHVASQCEVVMVPFLLFHKVYFKSRLIFQSKDNVSRHALVTHLLVSGLELMVQRFSLILYFKA
eukprot:IDg15747t1